VFLIGVCDKGEVDGELNRRDSISGLAHCKFELLKKVSCKLLEKVELDVLIIDANLLSPLS
jgi:hypothetical protein